MKRKIAIAAALALGLTSTSFAADNLKDMFAQSYGKGEIRMLDFKRDFDEDTTTRRDNAIGGLLYLHTGDLKGVSFGATFAVARDMYSDDDDVVYGLLQRGADGDHEGFTRMQEYYIQGDWFNTKIKYGAQELNTPFMNKHDIRMLPKTYKGLTIENKSVDNLTLSAYYITDYMGWADDEFISASKSISSSIDDDKPVLVFGAQYNIPVDSVKSSVQAWHYNMPDIFNETYLNASVSKDFGGVTVYVSPTVLDQRSQGDELAGELDTDQYGFNAGVKFKGFDITGFYAKTGDDDLLVPWGDTKVIIQQILASGRAEEKAYAGKINYDFGTLGVKGLSAYVFHAVYDTPESGSNASADMKETDFSIQYAFSGALDGLGLRTRYAMVDVDDGEDYDDTRFYVTYKFAFGGAKK
ncbi:OprD family outer membrane porin [Seleniivibrio sp.]|uniref:OprD family outer membrane porin n=1 Tax=Seleniivibrio sp. TaxID=2898801 RepID=UPI0025CE1A08|nr:OprD family outer membrane porin [Seleniivibrio sp.]MCD8554773.1 OprD family porin [Seleniivibrio sp.]